MDKIKLFTLGTLLVVLLCLISLLVYRPWSSNAEVATTKKGPQVSSAPYQDKSSNLPGSYGLDVFMKKTNNNQTVITSGFDRSHNTDPKNLIDDHYFQNYLSFMANEPDQIIDTTVAGLLYALSIRQDELKHADIYADILYRWKSKDLSQLASDKQQILDLQE